MARGNTEFKEIFRGRTLAIGGVTRFSTEFPLGEGWYRMILRFNHVVTIGTGTGPLSQGGLRAVRGITLRSDKAEFFCNNIPARALYFFDQMNSGTPAKLDTIAASNGTYVAMLPIWFYQPRMLKPEDYIINTARYSALTLEITYGGVADLYGTVGTSSVAPTVDCKIERQRGAIPKNIRPRFFVEYGVRTPLDPTSTQEILLERAANLSYMRWLLFGSNTTTISGVPFSGDAADIFTDLTVDHDAAKPYETILHAMLNALNKTDYSFESQVVGLDVFDFVRDGSFLAQMYSGDKSRLSQKWTNGTLGSTPQVSLAYQATRPLV